MVHELCLALLYCYRRGASILSEHLEFGHPLKTGTNLWVHVGGQASCVFLCHNVPRQGDMIGLRLQPAGTQSAGGEPFWSGHLRRGPRLYFSLCLGLAFVRVRRFESGILAGIVYIMRP